MYATTIDGQPRVSIARFSTPQAALQSLGIAEDGSGGRVVTWARSQAGPELALPPQLLFSLGGGSYTSAGTMERIGGGWRMTGFVPPLDQSFSLRARGSMSSGMANGSGGLVESARQFYIPDSDRIFDDGFE